ncbi:LacI family DNA-binding transcriptional regulator [Clostridia bacterium]|nr:LacI family DNA-binding transcriptional regulator [Clostridia bacterium]
MATIKDIAERVGVSTCTVSRYINRKIVVKEETAKKIDEAIKELDYHKNYMAVSLKTRSSKIIALVIPSLKNVFFAEIADNIASRLEKKGYSMITFTTDNNYEKEMETCERLLEVGVAGVIFMTKPFDFQNDDHLERLRKHNIVTLMINRNFEPKNYPSVSTDFKDGVQRATRLLIEKGCKNIGLIVGAKNHPQSDIYREPFIEVMQDSGFSPDSYHVKTCHFSPKEMEKVTEELLDDGVDAIFGISDFITLSALKVIEKRGFKIPQDIMLIGSGNTQFSELVNISSLDSRTDLLGQKGAEMLLALLEGKETKTFILVKPDIVERASTN